jgi:hypothetical protein
VLELERELRCRGGRGDRLVGVARLGGKVCEGVAHESGATPQDAEQFSITVVPHVERDHVGHAYLGVDHLETVLDGRGTCLEVPGCDRGKGISNVPSGGAAEVAAHDQLAVVDRGRRATAP